MRAATTIPAESQDASLVSSPATATFPVIVAGRLPFGFARKAGLEFQLQVYTGSAGAEIGLAYFAAEAHV